MGAKRRLSGTSKVNRQTHRNSYGQIDLQKASAQRACFEKNLETPLSFEAVIQFNSIQVTESAKNGSRFYKCFGKSMCAFRIVLSMDCDLFPVVLSYILLGKKKEKL